MLRFTCEHCGRELQARPEHAQRSMNCPGCMKPVSIPAGAGTRQTATAPPPAGGRSMLVVIVGALLLLVVGGAAGVWWFTKHKQDDAGPGKISGPEDDGPEVSDMALLPANAQLTGTTTVNVMLPGQLYSLERINLMDMRFAKIVRFGDKRLDVGIDLYNLFNSNVTTAYQQTYEYATNGAAWLTPTGIAAPRLARFNVTLNF